MKEVTITYVVATDDEANAMRLVSRYQLDYRYQVECNLRSGMQANPEVEITGIEVKEFTDPIVCISRQAQ